MLNKVKSKKEFVNEFLKYNDMADQFMKKNDYKNNNKIVKQLIKFIDKNKNEDFFEKALGELIDYNNPEIQVGAANYSLKYHINIEKSLKTLKNISKKKNIGLASLHADMSLKTFYNKYKT